MRTKRSVHEPSRTPLQTRADALLQQFFPSPSGAAKKAFAAKLIAAARMTATNPTVAAAGSTREDQSSMSPARALQQLGTAAAEGVYHLDSLHAGDYNGLEDLLLTDDEGEGLDLAAELEDADAVAVVAAPAAAKDAAAASANHAAAVPATAAATSVQQGQQDEEASAEEDRFDELLRSLSAEDDSIAEPVGDMLVVDSVSDMALDTQQAIAAAADAAIAVPEHATNSQPLTALNSASMAPNTAGVVASSTCDPDGFPAVQDMLDQLYADAMLGQYGQQEHPRGQLQQVQANLSVDAAVPFQAAAAAGNTAKLVQGTVGSIPGENAGSLPPVGSGQLYVAPAKGMVTTGTAPGHSFVLPYDQHPCHKHHAQPASDGYTIHHHHSSTTRPPWSDGPQSQAPSNDAFSFQALLLEDDSTPGSSLPALTAAPPPTAYWQQQQPGNRHTVPASSNSVAQQPKWYQATTQQGQHTAHRSDHVIMRSGNRTLTPLSNAWSAPLPGEPAGRSAANVPSAVQPASAAVVAAPAVAVGRSNFGALQGHQGNKAGLGTAASATLAHAASVGHPGSVGRALSNAQQELEALGQQLAELKRRRKEHKERKRLRKLQKLMLQQEQQQDYNMQPQQQQQKRAQANNDRFLPPHHGNHGLAQHVLSAASVAVSTAGYDGRTSHTPAEPAWPLTNPSSSNQHPSLLQHYASEPVPQRRVQLNTAAALPMSAASGRPPSSTPRAASSPLAHGKYPGLVGEAINSLMNNAGGADSIQHKATDSAAAVAARQHAVAQGLRQLAAAARSGTTSPGTMLTSTAAPRVSAGTAGGHPRTSRSPYRAERPVNSCNSDSSIRFSPYNRPPTPRGSQTAAVAGQAIAARCADAVLPGVPVVLDLRDTNESPRPGPSAVGNPTGAAAQPCSPARSNGASALADVQYSGLRSEASTWPAGAAAAGVHLQPISSAPLPMQKPVLEAAVYSVEAEASQSVMARQHSAFEGFNPLALHNYPVSEKQQQQQSSHTRSASTNTAVHPALQDGAVLVTEGASSPSATSNRKRGWQLTNITQPPSAEAAQKLPAVALVPFSSSGDLHSISYDPPTPPSSKGLLNLALAQDRLLPRAAPGQLAAMHKLGQQVDPVPSQAVHLLESSSSATRPNTPTVTAVLPPAASYTGGSQELATASAGSGSAYRQSPHPPGHGLHVSPQASANLDTLLGVPLDNAHGSIWVQTSGVEQQQQQQHSAGAGAGTGQRQARLLQLPFNGADLAERRLSEAAGLNSTNSGGNMASPGAGNSTAAAGFGQPPVRGDLQHPKVAATCRRRASSSSGGSRFSGHSREAPTHTPTVAAPINHHSVLLPSTGSVTGLPVVTNPHQLYAPHDKYKMPGTVAGAASPTSVGVPAAAAAAGAASATGGSAGGSHPTGHSTGHVYRTSSGKVLRMLTHPITGRPLLLGPAVDAKTSRLGNTSLGAPAPQLFGHDLQSTQQPHSSAAAAATAAAAASASSSSVSRSASLGSPGISNGVGKPVVRRQGSMRSRKGAAVATAGAASDAVLPIPQGVMPETGMLPAPTGVAAAPTGRFNGVSPKLPAFVGMYAAGSAGTSFGTDCSNGGGGGGGNAGAWGWWGSGVTYEDDGLLNINSDSAAAHGVAVFAGEAELLDISPDQMLLG